MIEKVPFINASVTYNLLRLLTPPNVSFIVLKAPFIRIVFCLYLWLMLLSIKGHVLAFVLVLYRVTSLEPLALKVLWITLSSLWKGLAT